MDRSEQVQRGLRRLKQAIARIEADLDNKAHLPLDPPIAQEDRNVVIDLIRLAIWEEKEQDRPRLTPDKEGIDWMWICGKKLEYAPRAEDDETFWITNGRHEFLKMKFQHGDSVEELQLTFAQSKQAIITELIRQGLLPDETSLQ
ncbi:MAG: hypothetical protein MRJ96_00745 [Nitrospirales bacterium]|nr:hypothetical protein [Nitrospira sp.]MDR4499968.1 hypothetical protein [Nitrospirales bacterium]